MSAASQTNSHRRPTAPPAACRRLGRPLWQGVQHKPCVPSVFVPLADLDRLGGSFIESCVMVVVAHLSTFGMSLRIQWQRMAVEGGRRLHSAKSQDCSRREGPVPQQGCRQCAVQNCRPQHPGPVWALQRTSASPAQPATPDINRLRAIPNSSSKHTLLANSRLAKIPQAL